MKRAQQPLTLETFERTGLRWSEHTRAFFETLEPRDAQAILRGFVTRGRRIGQQKRNPPCSRKDPDGFAAWHALRAARHYATWGSFPASVGMGGMVMYGGSETFSRIADAVIDDIKKLKENKA